MPNSNVKAHIALFLVNLIYGGNYSIAKIALPAYIKPYGFILIRVFFACLLYWLLKAFLVQEKVSWKDKAYLFLCGMFGVATNQLFFFKGLSITSEINASLLMITTPILVMLISVFMKRESMNLIKFIGLLLGVAGALLLIAGRFNGSFQLNQLNKGDLFIVFNAISYSFYLVLVKKMMEKYNPLTVISHVFLFGLIPVAFIGFKQFSEVEWSSFTPAVWLSVIYVVIATTFLAYLLNVYALKRVNPSLVGIYIYLQPLFAAFISILLGKPLSMIHFIAALLIFSGVFFVSNATLLFRRKKN